VQEGATVHSVAAGENLYRISLRYDVSVQAMAWANGLGNPNLIYVGQRLVIPNRTSEPASNPLSPDVQSTVTLSAEATAAPTSQPPAAQPQSTAVPAPTQAAEAAPAASVGTGKEIVVVLHEQKVYAYQNGKLVHSSLASTGIARYPTPVGRFRIYTKYISTLMTGPGYYLPNVPYTMYFYAGYGLHGTYWHNNFGHPMSHGCVNLPTSEARWLYEWAPVGTPVTVKR
jgi:lipoprotein-anchoring transpeptidase ErfK/SrfK